jgi:hypothetical protein
MSKTLTIISNKQSLVLQDREIIDMELKINLLNWDRKYNNIARECFDLYYNNSIHEIDLEVTPAEFDYVAMLSKRSYQNCYNEKYGY